MNPRQYQEVMEIVDRVMDSPPEELTARIKQECPDEGLRRAVLNLLAEDKQGSRFLEDPPLSILSSPQTGEQDSLIGRRVGHYRITEELGRGGMGAVYKGVREDEQYKTEVAIKLIKRGMDTDFILRRFRNERQIMANLHHPNIAPLLDGGTTEDGVPYFIMEYIDGRPINQYCDDKNLSITERLKLFRTVCAAVQYAHQNLVIHRDIKPGNILVTRDGTPKLLDFGIAKILGSDSAVQPTDPTATAFRVMTPEYASPEQVRGLQMTTASDVYSLGVLLYESLTGHRPYRFESRRPDEIAQVICDQEPLKPSMAVSRIAVPSQGDKVSRPPTTSERDSEVRNSVTEKLRSQLRGDLDNIVLMAIRKDSSRRYPTVEQFSEDIQRFLDRLPVRARKDTLSYRTEKFIQRNKVGVFAAALLCLTLVGGIVATLYQARRAEHQALSAERRLSELRGLTNYLMFELNDEMEYGPTQTRIMLVRKASEYLNRFSQETNSDPSLTKELATAYIKLGDLQGRPYRPNTGDSTGALVSYRQALRLLGPLAASDSANVEIESAIATIYERISFLSHRTGDVIVETDYKRRALALREALWASDKGNREYRRRLADSYITLNDVEHYRRALELREEIAREEPANTQNLRDVAQALQRIGNRRLADDAANNRLSLENHSRALALWEQIAASSSANVQDQRDLADQLMLTGDSLIRLGKAPAAIRNYDRALELFRSLAMTDPANAEARRDLSFVHLKLGQAKTQMHDAAAHDHLLNALHIAQELGKRDSNREDLITLLVVYEEFALSSEATGDLRGALENSSKSVTIRQQLSSLSPDSPARREELAIAYQNLGRLFVKSAVAAATRINEAAAPWREARNLYQKSLDIWQDMHQQGTLRSAVARQPGQVARELARCDAALAKL